MCANCSFSIVLFYNDPTDFKDEYEALFIKPVTKGDTKPLPLIVFPHGGPHATFTPDFSLYNACLCKLGFAILGGKVLFLYVVISDSVSVWGSTLPRSPNHSPFFVPLLRKKLPLS